MSGILFIILLIVIIAILYYFYYDLKKVFVEGLQGVSNKISVSHQTIMAEVKCHKNESKTQNYRQNHFTESDDEGETQLHDQKRFNVNEKDFYISHNDSTHKTQSYENKQQIIENKLPEKMQLFEGKIPLFEEIVPFFEGTTPLGIPTVIVSVDPILNNTDINNNRTHITIIEEAENKNQDNESYVSVDDVKTITQETLLSKDEYKFSELRAIAKKYNIKTTNENKKLYGKEILYNKIKEYLETSQNKKSE